MKFRNAIRNAVWILLTEQVASRARLQHELGLSQDSLNALVDELTRVKKWAVIDMNDDLVWALNDPAVGKATVPLQRASLQESVSEAERRQLTVMFCDLAGSTELSNELDPEDMNELITAYQSAVAPVVKQFDGFVAKYMGDGILIYFGYPKAQEKDAERAVFAGLGIIEAIRKLAAEHEARLYVRIGIATGTVVVGELIGEGEAQERSVVGDTPNLAARLQDAAPPNGIVISEVTRDLAGEGFEVVSLGSRQLKGIDGPVEIWQVMRELDEDFSIEADETRERSPLVGRQEELGLLIRAWQQSQQGSGEVVTISGEPGIGKSRLVEAILSETAASGAPRISLRCSPHHSNSALYPVILQVRRVLGWGPTDTDAERLAKLEKTLATYKFTSSDTLQLFAALFSLPLDSKKYPPLNLSLQQLRLDTLDTLLAWLFEEAERRPTVVVWEDLHWADPSTLEMLEMMIEQCPTAPILNVLTFRPEFVPGWSQRSHILPITLSRLERPEVESLIDQVCRGKRIPPQVVDHIVARGDGVPLYITELTSAILSSDALRATPDGYELAGPLEDHSIPATLQDSLLARLDKSPNVREVAQLGAVFGREFAYELVQAMGAFDETALKDGLNRLVDEELLYKRGRLPRAKYMFKHALIQDAAYQSLLKRTRQRYHAAVANLLMERFSGTAETQPEILAHHFTEAGEVEKALGYWLEAGQHALRRSENYEAIGHLQKGLALLPAGDEWASRELAMLRPLATAYMATKGYGAPETIETLERARRLCGIVKDDSIYPVMFGVWLAALVQAQNARAIDITREMDSLVEKSSDRYAAHAAHAMSGHSYLMVGNQLEARRHYLACFELGKNFSLEIRNAKTLSYGLDIEVSGYAYSAWNEWLLGYPDTALERQRKALDRVERSNQSYSRARALYWAAVVDQFCGDYCAVSEKTDRAIENSRRQGLTMVETACRILSISAHSDLGEGGHADELGAAVDAYTATGARFQTSYHHTLYARLLASEGRINEGLDVLTRSLQMIQETGEDFFLPEVIRLQGELLLARDKGSEEAPTLFRQAIDLAADGQVRSLELRAATSLADWHSRNGDSEAARNVLSPVLSWFTQGSETRDLRHARLVMESL